jgi:hypothetical protein
LRSGNRNPSSFSAFRASFKPAPQKYRPQVKIHVKVRPTIAQYPNSQPVEISKKRRVRTRAYTLSWEIADFVGPVPHKR